MAKDTEKKSLTAGDSEVDVEDTFDVDVEQLNEMVTNNSKEILEEYGGVEGLAKALRVDLKTGLTEEEAATGFAERHKHFGKNTYKQPKSKNFFQLWLEAINDVTMIILIISAVVSIILAYAIPKDLTHIESCDTASSVLDDDDSAIDGIEGFGIIIAVIVVSTVSAGQNYSKERKFRALSAKEQDFNVKVRRDGQIKEISITQVNAGDIAIVDTGSQVPADGVFLRGNNIQVDESQVNGETTPSKKSIDNPFFVSGCKLTDGTGEFLVTSVGDKSQWGRIMAGLQTKDRETPLQENLDAMAKLIGYMGMSVAGLILLILIIIWLVPHFSMEDEYECKNPEKNNAYDPCYTPYDSDSIASHDDCRVTNKWGDAVQIVDFVIVAITIIAVAVPEGLPLAVTISLAYSMKQMFDDKNLVRKLKACETMSNCTNICSDKTGTLTENRMTVVGSYIGGKKWTSNIRRKRDNGDDGSEMTDEEREEMEALRRKKLFAEFDRQSGKCCGVDCNKEDKTAAASSEGVEMSAQQTKVDAPEYGKKLVDMLDVLFSMNSGQTSNFMIETRKIDEDSEETADLLVTTGNKTECALLMHLQLLGRDYRQTRADKAGDVFQTFPFASARKRMSTLMWKNKKKGILRMYIKGAPEIIMGRSLYYAEEVDGKIEVKALTEEVRKKLQDQLMEWAEQGLRTLCFGYRDFKAPEGADPINPETLDVEGIEQIECEPVKEHNRITGHVNSFGGKKEAKEEPAEEAKEEGAAEGEEGDTTAEGEEGEKKKKKDKKKKEKKDKKKKKEEEEPKKKEEDEGPANVTSPLGLGPFDEPIACHMEDGEWKFDESPDSSLIVIGIVGIEDPVRPEVPPAVELCQMAGVTVRMVTGDNIVTARSIAHQCKIYTPETGGEAIEGPVFAKLSDDEIREKLPNLQVIARCSPFDKQRLVELLIGEGEVVAVTGDGTNDVLALKAADVGLAMGIRGTDIAKQASDIVILDDNFKSIVRSVMWGRNVYDNIRKFLQFQLTVNFAALAIVFIGAVGQRGAPLKAIQLLWVNLIMDTLAALALGTEKPTGDLLNRKPFGRYDPLLSPLMIRSIAAHAIYQIAVILVVIFAGPKISWFHSPCAYARKPTHHEASNCIITDSKGEHPATSTEIDKQTTYVQSIVFNAFVYCQVFNQINARRVNGERNPYKGMFSNPMYMAIFLLIAILQAVLILFTGPFMQVAPFPGIDGLAWLTCLVLGAMELPIGFLITFIPVPERKPRKKLSDAKGCCGMEPVDYEAERREEEEEERKRREALKSKSGDDE